MKVYVAAASSEIERAELMIDRLRSMGITVVSTWPEVIRRVASERNLSGKEAGNPKTASVEDRRRWALGNTESIDSADIFWMLVPSEGHFSHGAYFELGYTVDSQRWRHDNAGKRPITIIASCGDQRYVFVALADELHATDDEAFRAILDHAICSDRADPELTERLLGSLTATELAGLEQRYVDEPYALARIHHTREQMTKEGRFNVDVCVQCGSPVEGSHTCPGVPGNESVH